MILIPEQVKALRDEIKRLEEQKKDYEEYLKSCEKTSMDLGFIKYADTTLEVDNYNDICKKIEAYKRALVDNKFIDSTASDFIDYGTEFTIIFDDTKEKETYTLVENLIGLTRANINQDKGYIPYDGNLGKAVWGKTVDDNFSYTFNLKGRKDAITITGKIIDIVKKSNSDIHFITSRPKSARISMKSKELIDKLYEEGDRTSLSKMYEITLSQYQLLQEEEERLINALTKLQKYEDRIMVGSVITLKDKANQTKKYTVVDKEDYDVHSEINANSIMASRLFSKHKGDFIEERYSYKKNGKDKTTIYIGEIVEIDNSFVSKQKSNDFAINSIYNRLDVIDRLLKTSINVIPSTDDTIGAGSKVSIMTFEDGQIQNRRVEIINQAVSTELNTDYIEAISPLGEKIIGLKDNQDFSYRYYSTLENKVAIGNGIVYDINNNMNETLAKDPTAYQKKRRG